MSYSPRRRDVRIRPVDEDATKVFVGGLNFSTPVEVVEDVFGKFGKLRKAEVRTTGGGWLAAGTGGCSLQQPASARCCRQCSLRPSSRGESPRLPAPADHPRSGGQVEGLRLPVLRGGGQRRGCHREGEPRGSPARQIGPAQQPRARGWVRHSACWPRHHTQHELSYRPHHLLAPAPWASRTLWPCASRTCTRPSCTRRRLIPCTCASLPNLRRAT